MLNNHRATFSLTPMVIVNDQMLLQQIPRMNPKPRMTILNLLKLLLMITFYLNELFDLQCYILHRQELGEHFHDHVCPCARGVGVALLVVAEMLNEMNTMNRCL